MGTHGDRSRFGNIQRAYGHGTWKKSGTNIYDPSYHVAVLFAFPLLKRDLDTREFNVVHKNIIKNRDVIRISTFVLIFSAWQTSQIAISEAQLLLIFLSSLSVLSGVAWFTIAVGAVKDSLFGAVLDLTKWMLLVFVLSMSVSVIVLAQIVAWPVTFVLSALAGTLYFAAVQYDLIDSLTTGEDEYLRKFSLTMLAKLKAEGVEIVDNPETLEKSYSDLQQEDKTDG